MTEDGAAPGEGGDAGTGPAGKEPADPPPFRETLPTPRGAAHALAVGLFMGTADGVPGVSGGTIALIAGVYERLIAAITAITPTRFVRGLAALAPPDVDLDRAGAVLDSVDGYFLVALGVGMGTAVIGVTGVVDWAKDAVPALLFGAFFGLIAASAAVLFRSISVRRWDEILAAVGGFLIAFLVSGQADALASGGLALTLLGGAVSISAMILPGISGSLMLVILGQYTRMSETLHRFLGGLVGLARGDAPATLASDGAVIGTFLVGGLVGLFTVARVVRAALDRNRGATLAFLVALVVGGLRAPVVRLGSMEGVAWTQPVIWRFGAAALVGAAVVIVLEHYAVDLDLREPSEGR